MGPIARAGQHGSHYRTATHEQGESLVLYGHVAVISTTGCKSICLKGGNATAPLDHILGSSTDAGW